MIKRTTNIPNLKPFKKIAIVGRVGVGKTHLAGELMAEYKHDIIHTDDYIEKSDFKDAPNYVIDVCNKWIKKKYIVEGVQVSRMLRTGLRDDSWQPDVVLFVECRGLEVEKSHKSLASLTRNAMADWIEENQKQDHPAILIDVTTEAFEE